MTISEAISMLDDLVPNTYAHGDKVRWLSELDGQVQRELILTHQGEHADFPGYGEDTDPDTVLLIAPPYDRAYPVYLEAQLHYYNGETARYNNAVSLFDTHYAAYERWYNRTHLPLSGKRRF